jgi:hypothetical protein
MSTEKGRRLLSVACLGLAVMAGPARAGSPPEQNRRQLLQELGLGKQDPALPAPAAAGTPSSDVDERATPAPRADQSPRATPDGAKAAPPSFRRAIHPALMATCGPCHRTGGPGAATRFLLSGTPEVDHSTVVRLVDLHAPAASVLLGKVSGRPHAGGAPWPADSGPYARLLTWIERGARLDPAAAASSESAAPPVAAVRPRGAQVASSPPAAAPAAPAATAMLPPTSAEAAPVAALPTRADDFGLLVHPILMDACSGCHRAGALAAHSRLILTGEVSADEAVARLLVDVRAPASSPLLAKASGHMHGGGTVLPAGEARYDALLAWVTTRAAPLAPVAGPAAPPAIFPAPAINPTAQRRATIAGQDSHPGLALPFDFTLNGRFDLAYERRQVSGYPFAATGVDALRSYHHFLFLSRDVAAEPCGLAVELLTLLFWEAHCRVDVGSPAVRLVLAGGKIVVPFGADPLFHQSYGGLSGFDQRILPVVWAEEGAAAHVVVQRAALAFTDDIYVVRGYTLSRADAVLNLQNDFSPVDQARLGWGNRLGAAWLGVSAWYSTYYNPLGFGRRLFMQAVDLMIWRQRGIPVLNHFSLGAGLLRADVSGGDAAGVGGPGQDYYHFGSYLQLRYHPTDWFYVQYRQGLHTFDNRRGVILDNSRLTSADGSTHNFGIVARYRSLTAGIYYFINLEKVDEIPDDLFRVSLTYDL